MLSLDDVNHIALLARIRLSETERKKFQKELEAILGFVGTLNEAETKDVEPTAQVTRLTNVFRKDEHGLSSPSALRDALLGATPQREGEYVKVKAVFV